MSADDDDSPSGAGIARRALERRRVDRRRTRIGGALGTGPGGVERRGAQRRRPAPRPPALEIRSTRRARPDGAEERRETLRAMLEMADERQARAAARRRDRPVMAPGVHVRLLAGRFVGDSGRIIDADYISSRVLVRLDDIDESLWMAFTEVGMPRGREPER